MWFERLGLVAKLKLSPSLLAAPAWWCGQPEIHARGRKGRSIIATTIQARAVGRKGETSFLCQPDVNDNPKGQK